MGRNCCRGLPGLELAGTSDGGRTGRRRRAVKGPIADLARIEWQGRTTYVLFDSDKQRNTSIQAAERELARELKSRGSIIRIVDIPDLPGLEKTGADDFLAHPEGGPGRMLEFIEHGKCLESPSINAADQDLDRATRAAWDALIEANNPKHMFRHGTLARIEQDENGTPVLRELNIDRVRYELARCARYYVNVKDKRKQHRHNTRTSANTRLQKHTRDTGPAISGNANRGSAGFMDCTLQLEPGYNAASHILRARPSFNLPDVPEKPTRKRLKSSHPD
jgi:hypothetical protein